MGRDSSYTEELGDLICEWVASGKTLNKLTKERPDINRATVYRWFEANEDFRDKYTRAKIFQRETWEDEIIEESDNDSGDLIPNGKGGLSGNHAAVQRSALKVSSRQWILCKLYPRGKEDPNPNANQKTIVLNVLPRPD